MTDRQRELLEAVANDCDNATAPFGNGFFEVYDPTVDETMGTSEWVAIMIRGFLASPKSLQVGIISAAAMSEQTASMPVEALHYAIEQTVATAIQDSFTTKL